MSTGTIATALLSRLDAATSPREVREVLSDALAEPRSHPEAEALGGIEDRAFRHLRRVSETNPELAVAVLRDDLLPRCLAHDSSAREDPWPSYSEFFGEWLKEIPFRHQLEVRQAAITSALTALGSDNVPGALRVAAQIGYADADLCRALEEVVAVRDDEIGDRALGVRVSLGTDPATRERLRLMLHDRIRARPTYRLFDVARRIGDTSSINVLIESWLAAPKRTERPQIDDMFALNAAIAIAARSDDPCVGADLWHRIQAVAAAEPDRNLFRALDAGVIAKIPSPGVIPDLIARLPRGAGMGRWFTYKRLQECVHPVQSTGWDTVDAGPLAVVQADAVVHVAQRGQLKSAELGQKEEAWEVLLCVGKPELLPSMDLAVRQNASGLVMHVFLELAACLGQPSLPSSIPPLLAGTAPDASWSEENELLVAQVGAVRAAHSTMSDAAFRALLDYEPAREGILVSVIEALAELAAAAARVGIRGRVETLLSLAQSDKHSTASSAAGAALARLLQDKVLTETEIASVASLAAKDDLDPFTRRAIFHAFASKPDVSVTDELLAAAEGLARSKRPLSEEEQRAGLASSGLLLYASRLGGEPLRVLQAERLGLKVVNDRVELASGAPPAVTYHLLAQWYPAAPERYEPAVIALLRGDDPRRVAPLITAIHQAEAANSERVIDALITRAHVMDGGRQAEPFMLELLADIAPNRLVSEEWSHLDHWMPEARAGLATALGRLRGRAPDTACERHLLRLVGDGAYGVRRAAYRTYAESYPDSFLGLMAGWAASEEPSGVELRRRAAEAVSVISDAGLSALEALEWDPEPVVREAFSSATEERRDAKWAECHLSRVLSVKEPSDVVRYWRHGAALQRLGNDRSIELLRKREHTPLPPNVRYWLERVRKGVQRRWDDVVRKWPDPWFTRRGQYEVVDGTLLGTDGTELPVRAHLWFAASDHSDGYHDWGGWAQTMPLSEAEALKHAWSSLTPANDHQLRIRGRNPARVVVTKTFMPAGQIVFSGSDHYPSAGNEEGS